MANPLFNLLGGGMPGNNNIIQQFIQFRNNFRGDPRQQIQQMLNNGQVSQADYNRAVQMAQQFSNLIH